MSTLVTLGSIAGKTLGAVYTAAHHDNGTAKKTTDQITFYRSGPAGSADEVLPQNRIVDAL